MNQNEYRLNFYLPRGIVNIANDGTVEMALAPECKLTRDEHAALAMMAQLLAKLQTGKLVDYDIKLASFEDNQELVKCEWLDSGNLKLHGPTTKTYRFSEDVEQAMNQARVFTCVRSIYKLLPRRRNIGK
jgi:hypothetical protein